MKPYTKGMNSAGETPAQVANYLTANLRVLLRNNPEAVDELQSGIVAAIAEAVYELDLRTFNGCQSHGGWSSLLQRAKAWDEICDAASEIDPEWAMGGGNAVHSMKERFFQPAAGKGRGKKAKESKRG